MRPVCHWQGPFKGINLRAVAVEGHPWFAARDVCAALGIADPSSATKHFIGSEKGPHPIRTPGGTQRVVCVSESGLYRLIMRSDKPVAREFQNWVVRDVLPAIRKDGGYVMGEMGPGMFWSRT